MANATDAPKNDGELAQSYNYALRVINQNPELKALFHRAVNAKKGQWTPDRFAAAVKNSDWYENNAEYARNAWVAEMTGGADWKQQIQDATTRVQQAATKIGANIPPEKMAEFAHRYIYEGWGDPARQQLMLSEMAKTGTLDASGDGFMRGESGNLQQSLMQTAARNGVKLNQSYYAAAARSVAMGLQTPEDFQRELRTQAASYWPAWSDKIMAGLDAQDLASGYINTMAKVMEVNPDTISLDDPRLRSAMTGVDDKGNPKQMGLWEFETQLKSDPAWMKTKQATDTVSSIGTDILRKFGFMG